MSAIFLNGTKYGGGGDSGGLPSGGTTGQILTKKSNSDGDAKWSDPSVTKDVDDLTNYYTKSETYTQAETRTLIDNAVGAALSASY